MSRHLLERSPIVALALAISLSAYVAGADPQAAALPEHRDWRALEAPLLTQHVRLTDPAMFDKAGEAYFSPDGSWIIFQAVPVPPEGEAPSPHYLMYVAKLAIDDRGLVTGLENEPMLLSPPGSANTCGWFHPLYPWKVMFGSTLVPPAAPDQPGFQVGTRRYVWAFPEEMTIVQRSVPEIWFDLNMRDEPKPELLPVTTPDFGRDATEPVPIFIRDGYDAEGSWSSCGRFILYTHAAAADPHARPDGDLWLYDHDTDTHTPLIIEPGYDGGPFFSTDDRLITYRSDRAGDNKLQLFISILAKDKATGAITGVEREIQITDDGHVNWAPYFHPDAGMDERDRPRGVVAYTSSRSGHDNYELFALSIDRVAVGAQRASAVMPRRLTFAEGFDGLGVFSPCATRFMWTSQRHDDGQPGRGSSQLWIAQLATDADPAGPLDERQAELLAILEAEIDEMDVRGAQAEAEAFGRDWFVTVRPSAEVRGRARVYRVRPDGSASRVERDTP